ncbi:MAG: hypothetical protein ACLP6G_02455 [Terriglobales bacterium]
MRGAVFAWGWFLSSLPVLAAVPPKPQPPASTLPLVAHASISARLGRNAPEYSVRPASDGFSSYIPNQNLTVHFGSRGVEVADGSALWRMWLRGYGYGENQRLVEAAVPRVNHNRIAYPRGSLTEWYVTGPAGLEQGFIIYRAPGETRGQPLTLTLALSGSLRATGSDRGQEVQLADRNQHTHWRYTGLAAEDAAGRKLATWLELRGDLLLIRVDDSGAQYPLMIDPIVQTAQLTRAGGLANDAWGYSVSMSGNTIVVGWPNAAVGTHQNQGAVYVFVMPANGWGNMTQTAELTASDGASGDALGASVAISGGTIVAGAPQATIKKHQNQGAAYVFVQPAGGWANMTQTAKLTATNGIQYSALGFSAATTGNTIVVGAPFQAGAVYVYNQPAGGWAGNLTQSAELIASGTDAYGLGSSVSINGTTIAAGAQASTVNSNFEQGAVYVYTQPAGGWVNATQNGQLVASDGNTFDELGYSVVVSDGVVVAGAPNAEINGNFEQGAAYVFVEPSGGWTNMNQTAKLTTFDGTLGASFGSALAMTNGEVLFCGAPGATIESQVSQGAAYIFVKPGTGWTTTSKFYAKEQMKPGTAEAEFGTGVALGTGAGVVTAPGATVGPNAFQGAAYVYQEQ